MSFNTIKTILGFLKSLFGKYTPYEFKANDLSDIYNYLPISGLISTSGQPTEQQFSLIKRHGFEVIINLAPHNVENSLNNERELLFDLNLEYIHIPVNFNAPSDADFDKFKAEMERLRGEKVWVHCAANMRVSAFIYRYRCRVLGESSKNAKESLAKIWQPSGPWKAFIA